MGLFDRLKRAESAPGRPVDGGPFDPFLGSAEAKTFVDLLGRGVWREARDLFAEAPDTRSRSFMIETMKRLEGEQAWVVEAAATEDAVSLLLAGARQTHWAWEARGGGLSDTVTEQGWELFFERLRVADDWLRHAARLAPEDPLPWAEALWSGLGLQINTEELLSRFDAAHEREPWNVAACEAALQILCEKWQGSHDEMFSFARLVASEAPKGSPVHGAIAMAHFERYLALDDRGGSDDRWERDRYFEDGRVAEEIRAAASDCVFHPDFELRDHGRVAVDKFLVVCNLARDHETVGRLLELADGVFGEYPWNYYGSPEIVLQECIRDAVHP